MPWVHTCLATTAYKRRAGGDVDSSLILCLFYKFALRVFRILLNDHGQSYRVKVHYRHGPWNILLFAAVLLYFSGPGSVFPFSSS